MFSSLSESGFIPTNSCDWLVGPVTKKRSHLFQRVASFLPGVIEITSRNVTAEFSSLSESGFIPTLAERLWMLEQCYRSSHLFQRVASFLQLAIARDYHSGDD